MYKIITTIFLLISGKKLITCVLFSQSAQLRFFSLKYCICIVTSCLQVCIVTSYKLHSCIFVEQVARSDCFQMFIMLRVKENIIL
jgi:hypothetical protein